MLAYTPSVSQWGPFIPAPDPGFDPELRLTGDLPGLVLYVS